MPRAINRIISALVPFLAAAALSPSARPSRILYHLEKVWEIRLRDLVKEQQSQFSEQLHYVSAVQFSNDERQVAVAMGEHTSDGQTRSHLLIAEREHPTEEFRQFDYEGGPSTRIMWSADGRFVGVAPRKYHGGITLLHVADGKGCQVPGIHFDFAGFIGAEFAVVDARETGAGTSALVSSYLVLYDRDCHESRRLLVPGKAQALDVSEARGLIALGLEDGTVLALDVRDLKIKDRWSHPHSELRFVDSGRAICDADRFSHSAPPMCRMIGTSTALPEPKLRGGWPFATASRGTLALGGDAKYSYGGFTETQSWEVKRLVLYDYRTGQPLVSIPPSFQHLASFEGGAKSHLPWAIAISPSGRYLAEGGADTLRLYEIRTVN